MGGMELGDQFVVTGRVWKRISENAANDDNPDITKYLGNADIRAAWQVDRFNQVAISAHGGKGAVRLEWLKVIGDPVKSNLRFQAQLFYGYGDTLVDYNRKRTVFNIGLALVDFCNPQASRTSCRFAYPLAGGAACGRLSRFRASPGGMGQGKRPSVTGSLLLFGEQVAQVFLGAVEVDPQLHHGVLLAHDAGFVRVLLGSFLATGLQGVEVLLDLPPA